MVLVSLSFRNTGMIDVMLFSSLAPLGLNMGFMVVKEIR